MTLSTQKSFVSSRKHKLRYVDFGGDFRISHAQRKNEEEEADDGGSDTNSHSSTRKYKYAERRSSMKYFTKTRMGGGKSNDSNV